MNSRENWSEGELEREKKAGEEEVEPHSCFSLSAFPPLFPLLSKLSRYVSYVKWGKTGHTIEGLPLFPCKQNPPSFCLYSEVVAARPIFATKRTAQPSPMQHKHFFKIQIMMALLQFARWTANIFNWPSCKLKSYPQWWESIPQFMPRSATEI